MSAAYDYDEACDAEVSRAEARGEVRRHCGDMAEFREKWARFAAECGDQATYRGGVVLRWLGY